MRFRQNQAFAVFVCTFLLAFSLIPGVTLAQGEWDVTLVFPPYPPASIGEWENNPGLGNITVYNNTDTDTEVRLAMTISSGSSGVIASFYSNYIYMPAQSSLDFTTSDLFDWDSLKYDHDYETTARRTGRLLEDSYTICATLLNQAGQHLLDDEVCSEFYIDDPLPPMLMSPFNEDEILEDNLVFNWTQVIINSGLSVHYALRIAEVGEFGTPESALNSKTPIFFENSDIFSPPFFYPAEGNPLIKEMTYVWQVQALDDDYQGVGSNGGFSEVWTFRYQGGIPPIVDFRSISGKIRLTGTNYGVGGAQVAFIPNLENQESGAGSWVTVTDDFGFYSFPEVPDNCSFTIVATHNDCATNEIESIDSNYAGDVEFLDMSLDDCPPHQNFIKGTVRDLYTGEAVPGAVVKYVPSINEQDNQQALRIKTKPIPTSTNSLGQYMVSGTENNSPFLMLVEAGNGYKKSTEHGFQTRDMDGFDLMVEPAPCRIIGSVKSLSNDIERPIENVLVHLTQNGSDSQGVSAYSDYNGNFEFNNINLFDPAAEHSFSISIKSNRFHPYTYDQVIPFSAGSEINSSVHYLQGIVGELTGSLSFESKGISYARIFVFAPNVAHDQEGASGPVAVRDENDWDQTSFTRPEGVLVAEGVSADDGSYRLTNVPINDPDQATDYYAVWIEHNSYENLCKGVRLEYSGQTATLDFEMIAARAFITGLVVAAEGDNQKIADATVTLLQPSTNQSGFTTVKEVQTGSTGTFTVPGVDPGLYHLKFNHPEYAEHISDVIEIVGTEQDSYDVQLNRFVGSLKISVKKDEDKGIEGVTVISSNRPQFNTTVSTDANGECRADNVVAGRVQLTFAKPGYRPHSTSVLVVQNEEAKLEVELEKLTSKLHVTVEDSLSGLPLSSMKVKLGKKEEETNLSGDVEFDDVEVGTLELVITAPDNATQGYIVSKTPVNVEFDDEKFITIKLMPAGLLGGVVETTENGSTVKLKDVNFSISGNDDLSAKSNWKGEFKVNNIPDGYVELVARKAGYQTYKGKWTVQWDMPVDIIGITMQKSLIDSLYGFPVCVDTLTDMDNGHHKISGSLVNVAPTFGLVLKDPNEPFIFKDVELDENYIPVDESVTLETTEVELTVFGFDGKMSLAGGLKLEYVHPVSDDADSNGTAPPSSGGQRYGRISGNVVMTDVVSKVVPNSNWASFNIPKSVAPSFWEGGINRGLEKFGLNADDETVRLKLAAVSVGIDYVHTRLDDEGFHFWGEVGLGESFKVQFEEMLIGRRDNGRIGLKAITLKTDPPISVPLGVCTVVDSSMTWNDTGFIASGAIILNPLNRTFGIQKMHIGPRGEFLSIAITADDESGQVFDVHGFSFTANSIGFGTDNMDDPDKPNVHYLAFSGQLELPVLNDPVKLEELKYAFDGKFTGKVSFNQTKDFYSVVKLKLGHIEIKEDEEKGQYVGFSVGVRFGGVEGLEIQASDFKTYFDGQIEFEEIGFSLVAGAAEVSMSVGYSDKAFDGKGMLRVPNAFVVGGEFHYGGIDDWSVYVVAGGPLIIGPVQIAEVEGGIGYQDATWHFLIGGKIAPSGASAAVTLGVRVELFIGADSLIIRGEATVLVNTTWSVGTAVCEINLTESTFYGAITVGFDKDPMKAYGQVSIGIKFWEWMYIKGTAQLTLLDVFHAESVIVFGENYDFVYPRGTKRLNGLFMYMTIPPINKGGSVIGIEWGIHVDQYAELDIPFNGPIVGFIEAHGAANAAVDVFGWGFSLNANIDVEAAVRAQQGAWAARGDANVVLIGHIGRNCASCNRLCWRQPRWYLPPLPVGAKACFNMHASFQYDANGWDGNIRF